MDSFEGKMRPMREVIDVKQSIEFAASPLPGSVERRRCKPTEYLIGDQPVPPSSLWVYLRVRAGFALPDVTAMIATSTLYSDADILKRVAGGSIRTLQRKARQSHDARLSGQQSAVVFQYARALEDAIGVFGSQPLAEAWLGQPCRHLEGYVPLEMIESAIGFQAVESYLQRVKMGVYQ